MNGLIEESQALTRRLDGLDERLWSRSASAEELVRHGTRELQQQVQALERQMRMTGSATEEAQRRQTATQRRTERVVKDLEWRLARAEQEFVARPSEASQSLEEGHLQSVLAEVEGLGARLAAVEVRCVATASEGESALDVSDMPGVRGAVEALERRLVGLESRVPQLQELCASLRVKVDGQLQRQSALNERLEAAQTSGLDELRGDVAEQRARQMRETESLIAELKTKVDFVIETADTSGCVEKVEALTKRAASMETVGNAIRKETQDLRAAFRLAFGRSGLLKGGGSPDGVRPSAVSAMMDQLGAVADHLEVLDDVVGRIAMLEQRVSESPPGSKRSEPPVLDDPPKRRARRSQTPQERSTSKVNAKEANQAPGASAAAALSVFRQADVRTSDRAEQRHDVRLGSSEDEWRRERQERVDTGSSCFEKESRRSSASCYVANSPSVSVDSPRELQEKCDDTEAVVSPGGTLWEPALGAAVGTRSDGSMSDGAFGRQSDDIASACGSLQDSDREG